MKTNIDYIKLSNFLDNYDKVVFEDSKTKK